MDAGGPTVVSVQLHPRCHHGLCSKWSRGKHHMHETQGYQIPTLLSLHPTNRVLPHQSTRTSAQCYVAAWMGGEFGVEWICTYVCLNPFTVYNTVNWIYVNTR